MPSAAVLTGVAVSLGAPAFAFRSNETADFPAAEKSLELLPRALAGIRMVQAAGLPFCT